MSFTAAEDLRTIIENGFAFATVNSAVSGEPFDANPQVLLGSEKWTGKAKNGFIHIKDESYRPEPNYVQRDEIHNFAIDVQFKQEGFHVNEVIKAVLSEIDRALQAADRRNGGTYFFDFRYDTDNNLVNQTAVNNLEMKKPDVLLI